jgi:hypothetical protein
VRLRHTPLVAAAAALAFPSAASGQLEFDLAPDVPSLGAVTLTGAAQTQAAQMPSWEVRDSRLSALGWHVTAQGDGGTGNSAVFKEYCSDGTAANGCDTAVSGGPGPGYVTGGATLPAGSLTLDSSGASFQPIGLTTGTPPSHLCSAGCLLDSASAVSVAFAAVELGVGTWRAQGYAADSLSLAVPTSTRVIGSGNKLYRVNVLWTLASGP